MTLSIAIVVPTWNRTADVGRCLASLARLTYATRRTIVVDNGSRASERAALHAIACGVAAAAVIELPENRGFAAAVNTGVAAAFADGCEVFPAWAQIIVVRRALACLHAEYLAEHIRRVGGSVHQDTGANSDAREKFAFMDGETGHAAPYFDFIGFGFAWEGRLPAVRGVKPFYRGPV